MLLTLPTPQHAHSCGNQKMSPNIVKCLQAGSGQEWGVGGKIIAFEDHCFRLFITIPPKRQLLPPSKKSSNTSSHNYFSVFQSLFSLSPGTWEILFQSNNLSYTFKLCMFKFRGKKFSVCFYMFPVKGLFGYFSMDYLAWVILVWYCIGRRNSLTLQRVKLLLKPALQNPGKVISNNLIK